MLRRLDCGATVARSYGIERSACWPSVEKAHLRSHPFCEACGKKGRAPLQVHHIFPFHYCVAVGRSDLELDDRNLITLCEEEKDRPGQNHHLLIGHLNDFRSSNLSVVKDAKKTFYRKTAQAIKLDNRWLKKMFNKLKPLDLMTAKEKLDLKVEMDKKIPFRPFVVKFATEGHRSSSFIGD